MQPADFTEPAFQLIERARAAGFPTSETQLARWHRAGLLPRPRQRSLGRGNGTQSVYPAGTTLQLLALCGHRQSVRALPDLGWCLWWDGYPVDQSLVVEFLTTVGNELDKLLAIGAGFFSPAVDGGANQQHSLTRAALVQQRLPPILAQARRRTGRDRFPDAIQQLFDLVFSDQDATPTTADEQLVATALGLNRAKKDWMAGVGSLLPSDILPSLSVALGHIGKVRFADVPRRAPFHEVEIARDEWRALRGVITSVGSLLGHVGGQYAFGLAAAGQIFSSMPLRWCAMMFLVWCRLREIPEFQQGGAAILDAANKAEIDRGTEAYQTVQHIRTEIPALRDVLSDQRLKRALANKREWARIASDISEYAKGNPAVIAQFRARRSEQAAGGASSGAEPIVLRLAHSEQPNDCHQE